MNTNAALAILTATLLFLAGTVAYSADYMAAFYALYAASLTVAAVSPRLARVNI